MKLLALICIITASTIATAQTESNTTMTEQVPTEQKPPVTQTSTVATSHDSNSFFGSITLYPQTEYGYTDNLMIWTTPGIKYNVSHELSFSVKPTFETLTGYKDEEATRTETGKNNFRAAFTDFTVSSSLHDFLGTTSSPISLNYKHMVSDAIKMYGWQSTYGLIEGNLSLPYTLTTNVDLSINNQVRHYINKFSANANRFSAIPSLSYTINDIFTVYQSAGYVLHMQDNNELRRSSERMYLETGVSMSPTKNLSILVDVNQHKAISAAPSSGVEVTNFSLYNPTISETNPGASLDGVYYESVITYKF